MSSLHNVILVIVFVAQWICQGITAQSSQQQNKVFLFLPKTTPLPPQLAYYVQNRKPNEHLDKSASTYNGGVLSVIKSTPYNERNRPTTITVKNPKYGFVPNQQYPKLLTSPNQPLVYQSSINDPPGSYNFQQYYGSGPGPVIPNRESIVRATPPPERRPGRTAPPPSDKVTFQVNMLERNYRAQQDFEQRNRNPHYRSQAIRQVESPILTTDAPKNHKVLRSNIKQLKKSQREHFNVDDDEHPARQSSNPDDVEEVTQKFNHKYKDLDQFRDEESHYDRIKKQRRPHDDDRSANYEQVEPKFTNFYDEIEDGGDGGKYLNHGDFVTPATYQNYNNDHSDQSDHHFEIPNFGKYKNYDDNDDDNDSDEPSSKYRYHDSNDNNEDDRDTFNPYQKNIDSYGPKAYITNEEVKEFDKYLRSTPRYVGPKKKQRIEIDDRNGYNDRSDKDVDFVPYKMLASVRHSERFEHQPKDLTNPLLKERILEKGGHVVYTEQGYEDKQYDHGNEEKFANVKHRRRRHISDDKFPFYYTSSRHIPKHSALRYAENGEHLRNGYVKRSLYSTKRKECDDVNFDDTNVNDKEVDFKTKKRLTGLEDKIDCLKEKLFGAEPLNNPIFQEHYVDEILPIVKPRRIRSSLEAQPFSTLVNVFDDVTSNIEKLSSSNVKKDHTPSASNADYVVFPPYIDLANSKMNSQNTSILDIVTNETSNHDHPPVVILMDEQAYAQMKVNDTPARYTTFFKYPQSDGTEVFIFDVSKFIPKFVLPSNDDDEYDSGESITTELLDETTDAPKKSTRMKLKMRRNQKKTLDWNPNKHLPRRHTNIVREGIQLAKQPFLLPGSYDLHKQGNSFR